MSGLVYRVWITSDGRYAARRFYHDVWQTAIFSTHQAALEWAQEAHE